MSCKFCLSSASKTSWGLLNSPVKVLIKLNFLNFEISKKMFHSSGPRLRNTVLLLTIKGVGKLFKHLYKQLFVFPFKVMQSEITI